MSAQPAGADHAAALRVVLVAGEASGDALGAGLIRELKALYPDIQCAGIAGPLMREAGCEAWWDADELAVMGLFEIIRDLPRLLKLRRALITRLLAERPAVLIGIDAPDFNLGVENRARAAGITTVHYVSPSVWAWREGRMKTIRQAVDLMLCLLPFEADYYHRQQLQARFVGHPLADELAHPPDQGSARAALGLAGEGPVLAVLPGSRGGEIQRMAQPYAQTIAWLVARLPALQCIVPVAREKLAAPIREALAAAGVQDHVRLVDGQARTALAAADAALVTSGTATLEAALLRTPMVVAYRAAPVTLALVRALKLIRVRHFALPNLLTQAPVVPEFLQAEVTAQHLGPSLLALLEDAGARATQVDEFAKLHDILRRDASRSAALAVASLLPRDPTTHEP